MAVVGAIWRSNTPATAGVDLTSWSNGDQFGAEGWRASDFSPGRIIGYAEPELKCWMPMPSANLNRTSMPSSWEGKSSKGRGLTCFAMLRR